MIVDGERLISDYLRAHPAVSALVGARVVGKTPADTSTAWVRVTQLDANDVSGSGLDHLINHLLQLDVYAGKDARGETHGQPEANLLARTVRAALKAMPGLHAGAVVSRVRIVGMPRVPDNDWEPARERVILTVIVTAHPTREAVA